MRSDKSKVLPTKETEYSVKLVLCYDDHVLLNNYVDHHLFTIDVNSGYSPMKCIPILMGFMLIFNEIHLKLFIHPQNTKNPAVARL